MLSSWPCVTSTTKRDPLHESSGGDLCSQVLNLLISSPELQFSLSQLSLQSSDLVLPQADTTTKVDGKDKRVVRAVVPRYALAPPPHARTRQAVSWDLDAQPARRAYDGRTAPDCEDGHDIVILRAHTNLASAVRVL